MRFMKRRIRLLVTDDPEKFLGKDYNPKDYEKLKDIVEFGLIVVQHIAWF